MLEIWSSEFTDLDSLPSLAQRLERDGWDGVSLSDSQNLRPDPYLSLTSVAAVTSRLRLGLTTNPITRHPAVAAAAATTLQRISGGRLTVTIGRGDSACAHIGLAPLDVRQFEQYIIPLRRFLRGESVPMEQAAQLAVGNAKPLSTLGLAGAPQNSELRWVDPSDAVQLEVAATGPRVLDIGARHADRVMLSVGAVPERIEWAMKIVRDCRTAAGLEGDSRVGLYLVVVANEDPRAARRYITPVLAATSRFAIMHGSIIGPTDAASAQVLRKLYETFDMDHHDDASSHAGVLDDRFIDLYGVAGTGEECARRLQALQELGVDKFVLFPLAAGTHPDIVEEHRSLMASTVLPSLR